MKKQNILQLLQDDYDDKYKIRKRNFYKCVHNFEKCVKYNTIPFLEKYAKDFKFDFEFNLEAEDDLIKYKSLYLLNSLNNYFFEEISYSPNYFHKKEQEIGFELACDDICANVLYKYIFIIKKELKGLKTDNKSITSYLKSKALCSEEDMYYFSYEDEYY